ncbi:MAG: hypothetical protein GTO18_17770 [Anaerolineales bacterium]|nr:hypothetical protein [Anaerolineales bacterium]
MLRDRIVRAFGFDEEVYTEVEHDTSFTRTAWLIVIVIAFLNQLSISIDLDLPNFIIGSAVGTVFRVIGFAIGAFVISWIGKTAFHADVTFQEMVRVLGLAYVFRIVGVMGIIGAVFPGLACLLLPIAALTFIAGVIAWFFAVRQALDLDIVQTVVTVILGFIAVIALSIVANLFLSILNIDIGTRMFII